MSIHPHRQQIELAICFLSGPFSRFRVCMPTIASGYGSSPKAGRMPARLCWLFGNAPACQSASSSSGLPHFTVLLRSCSAGSTAETTAGANESADFSGINTRCIHAAKGRQCRQSKQGRLNRDLLALSSHLFNFVVIPVEELQ